MLRFVSDFHDDDDDDDDGECSLLILRDRQEQG